MEFTSKVTLDHVDQELFIVEQPERSLSPNSQKELIPAIQEVASRGFNREVTLESAKKHAIVDKDYLFLSFSKKKLTGFAGVTDVTSRSTSFKISYIAGIALSPMVQGYGLGKQFFLNIIRHTNCEILCFTTQSPIMYSTLKRLSRSIYPSPTNQDIPVLIKAPAVVLMSERPGNFDPNTFVCRNLFSQCLYPSFPWSYDPEVNQFFKDKLHFENEATTDAFFLAGVI